MECNWLQERGEERELSEVVRGERRGEASERRGDGSERREVMEKEGSVSRYGGEMWVGSFSVCVNVNFYMNKTAFTRGDNTTS